jgi:PAS domain-containing protein
MFAARLRLAITLLESRDGNHALCPLEPSVSLLPDTPASNNLKRHESLQAGLDLIDQGFTLIDEKLCMVAWNQTFLRLLDFPPGMTHAGTPFEKFIRFNAERGE